jgi:GT2 family glycosyltransferase
MNILLASFIYRKDLENSLKSLKNKDILNEKIFVLRDSASDSKLVLTYNIASSNEKIDFSKYLKGTISLHRKRETNTLYTLNALNEIIKIENNGNLDKNYSVDWEKYRNCILIISGNGTLTKVKTILEDVKNLND